MAGKTATHLAGRKTFRPCECVAVFPAMTESALRADQELPRSQATRLPRGPLSWARTDPAWIYVYILVQLGCQLLLLIQELTDVRVFIRSAAFGTSLLFLAIGPRHARVGGVTRALALVALMILGLSMFNPLGGLPLEIGRASCRERV